MKVLTDYAPHQEAVTRMAELRDKASELESTRRELLAKLDSAEAPDADALVKAKDLEAALASDEFPSLKQEIDRVSRQLDAVKGAENRAFQEVQRTEALAKRELGKAMAGDYQKIIKRQAFALIELGQAAEKYQEFETSLKGTLADYRLRQMPLKPILGDHRGEGRFTQTLLDAVEAGAIRAKDIPPHWDAHRWAKKAAAA